MPNPLEKDHPLRSKKVITYLVAELSTKFLIGSGLYLLKDHVDVGGAWMWWWMIVATICVTFLEVGTVLGLAYVDRFVDVARVLGKGPGETSPPPGPTPSEAPTDPGAP